MRTAYTLCQSHRRHIVLGVLIFVSFFCGLPPANLFVLVLFSYILAAAIRLLVFVPSAVTLAVIV
jgi:hypothetical protein